MSTIPISKNNNVELATSFCLNMLFLKIDLRTELVCDISLTEYPLHYPLPHYGNALNYFVIAFSFLFKTTIAFNFLFKFCMFHTMWLSPSNIISFKF